MVKHYGELKEKGSLRNLSSFIKVKNDDSGISDNKKKKKRKEKVMIYSIHLGHIVPKILE